ncbi:MAG: hypothetical protein F6J90_41910 [Moorea sp. SIOASIH]|uniref:hypothetical protein n=1 Tax=Moorena sp. SIOASIH TaxID=2607817 RepID=UPI0013BCECFB|nr:hypothetical protein [Moorena sp. SIOASIH]NEO42527.1 hypothetical protein [Moorena sp. SIOASIH]
MNRDSYRPLTPKADATGYLLKMIPQFIYELLLKYGQDVEFRIADIGAGTGTLAIRIVDEAIKRGISSCIVYAVEPEEKDVEVGINICKENGCYYESTKSLGVAFKQEPYTETTFEPQFLHGIICNPGQFIAPKKIGDYLPSYGQTGDELGLRRLEVFVRNAAVHLFPDGLYCGQHLSPAKEGDHIAALELIQDAFGSDAEVRYHDKILPRITSQEFMKGELASLLEDCHWRDYAQNWIDDFSVKFPWLASVAFIACPTGGGGKITNTSQPSYDPSLKIEDRIAIQATTVREIKELIDRENFGRVNK